MDCATLQAVNSNCPSDVHSEQTLLENKDETWFLIEKVENSYTDFEDILSPIMSITKTDDVSHVQLDCEDGEAIVVHPSSTPNDSYWNTIYFSPLSPEKSVSRSRSENDWSLRATIPEPFKMTLREANKRRAKSATLLKYEKELETREKKEEAECYRKFRATPAPSHTYLPLYMEMVEKEEIRRINRKNISRDLTFALQQPFDFSRREEIKKHFRSRSEPNLSKSKPESTSFRARPVPKYILSEKGRIKQEEMENIRSIQSRIRAEEQLKASVSPIKMRNKNLALQLLREKLRKAKEKDLKAGDHNKPVLAFDFPELEVFQEKLEKWQKQSNKHFRSTTVCEPFDLQTSKLKSRKQKIEDDIKRDEETLKETRWPFQASRMPVHSNSPTTATLLETYGPRNPRMNFAANLRMLVKKQTPEPQRRSDMWKTLIRKCVNQKLPQEKNNHIQQEKLKQLKADNRIRFQQYQQDLDEMMKKLEKRPLLMEQQSEMSARKQAEKKYLEKLQSEGLTEEFVHSKSMMKQSSSGDSTSSSRSSSGSHFRHTRTIRSSRSGSNSKKTLHSSSEVNNKTPASSIESDQESQQSYDSQSSHSHPSL